MQLVKKIFCNICFLFAITFLTDCKEYIPLPLLEKIQKLPLEIKESSGLLFWNGSIWTHNDSGNQSQLYQLSPDDGQLTGSVTLENIVNTDWEDIAQDEDNFYIGDFGNNNGDRQDLRIHIIPKTELDKNQTTASTIYFNYPDQTDFSIRPKQHDFDCEAMVVLEDGIHLFSKNHLDLQMRHYLLPKSPGTYEATLKGTFASEGKITGADFDPETNTLFLLGYNKSIQYRPFIWTINGFCGSDFFAGQQQKTALIILQKTEGICFWQNEKLLITTEGRSLEEEALYVLDVAELLK